MGIALHSFLVGLLLLLATEFALRFGGWNDLQPSFFALQAGIFHLVLAAGYVAEHSRHRDIALLMIAKCTAAVFLLGLTVFGSVPWAVPFCGAFDGLLAVSMFAVHRRANAEHRREDHLASGPVNASAEDVVREG